METGQDVSLRVGFVAGQCMWLSQSRSLICSIWGAPGLHCPLAPVSCPIPFHIWYLAWPEKLLFCQCLLWAEPGCLGALSQAGDGSGTAPLQALLCSPIWPMPPSPFGACSAQGLCSHSPLSGTREHPSPESLLSHEGRFCTAALLLPTPPALLALGVWVEAAPVPPPGQGLSTRPPPWEMPALISFP